jgi:hypothetical protein
VIAFKPVAFRPTAVSSPALGRYGPKFTLSQTFDELFKWSSATGDSIRLIFHGATAALGFHVWIKDKGFFKWFGLLLAVGQTVGAICDVVSLVQRAAGTHPPEEQPKA